MSENLLEFKNVSKSFYGNQVLKNINMTLKKGEVHALIGENGAGKSTLMNILFGMPAIHETGGFEGTVEIEGKEMHIRSPHDAMLEGIGMVHQEFMLIPGFTITENIKLNREITKGNVVSKILGKRLEGLNYKQMNSDAQQALQMLDMDIESYTKVAGLPVGHMQFIEIAREIDKEGVKILVFDEPTAVLADAEAQNLLKAIRRLADTGIGIIFISHRLEEIVSVADTVTILRDGTHVATKPISETSAADIARMMIGRAVTLDRDLDENRTVSDEVVLSIRDLHVNMPGEQVKGINLDVHKGEIMGIGGLAGQGKLGIANGIMGIYPAKGEVTFEGKSLPLNHSRQVLLDGVAFVSEDRKGVGLLLDESIELNICFTAMQNQDKFLKNYGIIKMKDSKMIREHANKMIEELDIRCTSPLQKTGSLSGGNQQKVCVARALTQNPKLLLVSEPTRGIDIGAKKLVLDLLKRLNQEMGMTIVMTSSELAELRSICDNIAIVCDGKVAGILKPTDSDTKFGLMMSGITEIEEGGEE
ncbi:MAG: sugar ABC transporter ATP-binding protein [Otoolea sp.]|nr:sugar ABC transporter ATP-binding protein [Clostridium sp.]